MLKIWRRRRTMTTTTITPATTGDAEIIFRSVLLTRERDGAALSAALDRLTTRYPEIGRDVVRLGSLGAVVSYERAVNVLRTYADTSVILYPSFL